MVANLGISLGTVVEQQLVALLCTYEYVRYLWIFAHVNNLDLSSSLFGEADVQFLEVKWPFSRYAFQYQPQGKPSIRFWCCLVFGGIMEKMYQPCCCSSILHKSPLHPFFARPMYNFWKSNGRFCTTLFSINPKGSQVLGFDAAWYLRISWKRCISTVVV